MKKILSNMPEFCQSHWLLRIPLAIVFIQQGWMKIPVDADEASSYDLSVLVWWFVTYGEFLSGITMCCIMTGVIWVGEPESFIDVLLYDNLHVFLWVGGLFFALRGNRVS